ncbi:hypothetical protein CPB85DRAFT_711422 [Mucidula mucida]|nr:hypothetical protein CPB85DRAFT_711422 [Mucidula mucida]
MQKPTPLKNETNTLERIPSHTPSVTSLAPSLPVSSPKAKSIPLSSSPPTSDSLGLPISSSPFSVSNLRHRMGSDAAQASPPSAVDLHNAMAQQQQSRRDRSGSSSSRFEPSGLGLTFDSNGSMDPSSSPASRSTLRARTPSQLGHNRHRSGSTHRNATVFDDDVVVVPEERAGSAQGNATRPSILRTHNRSSSSSGHGSVLQASLRALRFDSGKRGSDSPTLRGSNSVNSLVRFVDTRDDRSRSGSPAMVQRDDKRPQSLRHLQYPTFVPQNLKRTYKSWLAMKRMRRMNTTEALVPMELGVCVHILVEVVGLLSVRRCQTCCLPRNFPSASITSTCSCGRCYSTSFS